MFKEAENQERVQKKEVTQGIIANIKEKISEFKNKKEYEKTSRKDELDFEVNQDLVNQFRKNKPETNKENINQNHHNTSKTNTNITTNINTNIHTESNMISPSYLREREQKHEKEREKSNDLLKGYTALDISSHSQDYLTNVNRKSDPNTRRPRTFGIGRNTTNNNNNYFFTKDHSMDKLKYVHSYINNTYHRSSNYNKKKDDLMSFLITKDSRPKQEIRKTTSGGGFNYVKTPTYTSSNSNNNNNNRLTTKDKIKKLFNQIDDNTDNNNIITSIKPPKYDFKSKVPETKYETCLTSKFSMKKDKEIHSIDSFGDFNINAKQPINKQIKKTFNSDLNNLFNLDNLTTNQDNISSYSNCKTTKTESTITSSSIKSLANKLTFLSYEDIQRMDKNLINELINLSNVIQRNFNQQTTNKVKHITSYDNL